MTLKRGDLVWIDDAAPIGRVLRIARSGSWVDVRWGVGTEAKWSKRQRKPGVLKLFARAGAGGGPPILTLEPLGPL